MRRVIVAVCGLPGSGKSTLVGHLARCLNARGITSVTLDDYSCLHARYRYDVMGRQFAPHPTGFNALNLGILDDVLVNLELVALRLDTCCDIVFVEFSRNDYLRALANFRPSVLENLELVFVRADLDSCIDRVQARVSDPLNPGNSSFDERRFRSYYGGITADGTSVARTEHIDTPYKRMGIHPDRITDLDSNCTFDEFLASSVDLSKALYGRLTSRWEEGWNMLAETVGKAFPRFLALPLDSQPGFVANIVAVAHRAATHGDPRGSLKSYYLDEYRAIPQWPTGLPKNPSPLEPSLVPEPSLTRMGLWLSLWSNVARRYQTLEPLPSGERGACLLSIVTATCDYLQDDSVPYDTVVTVLDRVGSRAVAHTPNAHGTLGTTFRDGSVLGN